jgi:hypothetical protein
MTWKKAVFGDASKIGSRMCGVGAALVVLLCNCTTIKRLLREEGATEMLRGQEGAQPGPHHPWSDDKHMVHESMFVTYGNTVPYFYRLFFFRLETSQRARSERIRSRAQMGGGWWRCPRTNGDALSICNGFSRFEWVATGERNFDAQMRTGCALLVF